MFTLTFDPQSPCPPLCQILKSLCYSPACCSVSEHLRTIQRMSVLGALHIMVGLLNIGLGVILLNSGGGSSWQMDETLFPVWLGVLFILFGVMCIISEKFPSLCLVSMNVILGMTGVAFAITAIVLYSFNMANIDMWWMCEDDNYEYRYKTRMTTTSPEKSIILERCMAGRDLTLMVLRGINGVLIVLSALELCVALSSVVLGIKALRSRDKREKENKGDPEQQRPLLEEFTK